MADLTEINREYFDKKAQAYATDFSDVTRYLSEETRRRRQWISSKWTDTSEGQGQEVKILEYACGPGHISMALEPFVTKAIGLDIAQAMVNEYNKQVREGGISTEKMFAKVGNIVADTVPAELSDPEYHDFDLVIVSMALHHLADAELAMKRLAGRLKNGGVLWIIDFVSGQMQKHEHEKLHPESAQTVHKHGFSADEISALYANAGLGKGFKYEVFDKPLEFTLHGHERKVIAFTARGEKA